MLFMKQRSWILFSGFMWLIMGAFLLYKGLGLISQAVFASGTLCDQMKDFFGSASQAGAVLIALGLLIGFFKGRFVLVKTVRRTITRIASKEEPVSIKDAYSPLYWGLIFGMMLLGMMFRFLPISLDLRGAVDVAVGSALIHGALFYFAAARRASFATHK